MEKLKNFFHRRSVQNAGWIIGGNIVNKILTFIVGIWTARFLGPGNYGLINYAAAYVTFFYSLATLGINSVLVKYIIDDSDNEGGTLGTALVLQGGASLLSIGAILAIVSVVDFGETLTILVVFLSSLGIFFESMGALQYWFQAKLKSKYSSIAATIAYIVTSAYKIVLLVTGKGVAWFALATSVDAICIALFLFITYKKQGGSHLFFSRAIANKLLRSSWHYILSGLMISIYGATDKLMLKQMLGETSVGYYGTAVSIANVWCFVLASIVDSMNPSIMGAYSSDKKRFINRNILLYRIIFYVSVTVSAGISIFAKFGINLLYGDAYMGAVAPLRIITWYSAFSYLGVARNAWVVCENKQKYLTGLYASSAVVNVLMNALLIPKYGASGAAVASLISQICTVFVAPVFIKGMRSNVLMMVDAISFRRRKHI